MSLGNENYIKIENFIKEHKISVPEFISLKQSFGGTSRDKFNSGRFEFFTPEEEVKAVEALKNFRSVKEQIDRFCLGKNKPSGYKLGVAILRLLVLKECDVEILLKKIAQKAESLHKCADKDGYRTMLVNVYNWKNPNPLEL